MKGRIYLQTIRLDLLAENWFLCLCYILSFLLEEDFLVNLAIATFLKLHLITLRKYCKS